VSVDNRRGGYLAAQHLVQLGHRRIAYVGRPADCSSNQNRLAGYHEALSEAGIPFHPDLLVPTTGRVGGGERVLAVLMALEEALTAVFCYNDMTAIGLLRAVREVGLGVPCDLAVVRFNNILVAAYAHPALTTIA